MTSTGCPLLLRHLVVIVRDKRIRTRPQEIARFREVGLRVFWLGGKRDLTTWGYLRLVLRHWDRMEETIQNEGPGPWGFVVTQAGLVQLM